MLAALAGALAAAAQPADPGECGPRLCNARAIASAFAGLEPGVGEAGGPFHILQIGDSHTAGDMITGGWRSRLQARRGAGGRGVLAAGRPYPGYLTWGVTASQSAGWRTNATFGGRYAADGPALGISGFTQTARGAGERLGLSADSDDFRFDRIIVCAMTGPGAGAVMLRIGAAEERWSLEAPLRRPACRTVDSDAPVATASIETLDAGAVSITSFGSYRRDEGAVLSSVGVVGAQLAHFGRTDDALVRAELQAHQPGLIVLAFGTNEGFSPALTADGYEATLRAQVARLRRLAGGDVPILLLGAPDAARRAPARGNDVDCGDGWSVPGLLGEVRRRQRRVAEAMDLAFWDWAAAMGGACASSRWVRAGDMRGDHVHFSRAGGERIGSMLYRDLAEAGADYLGGRGE